MSLLRQDGLHRDVPPGACHLRARRNLHRGGEYANSEFAEVHADSAMKKTKATVCLENINLCY